MHLSHVQLWSFNCMKSRASTAGGRAEAWHCTKPVTHTAILFERNYTVSLFVMNIHSKTGSLKKQWYQSHCFSLVSSGNLMFRMDKSAELWQPLFSWKWSIIRWTHWHLVTVVLNFWLLFLHIFKIFFYSSTAASSFPLTTVDEILNSLSSRAQAASKARIAISRGSEGEKRRNRDRHTHKEQRFLWERNGQNTHWVRYPERKKKEMTENECKRKQAICFHPTGLENLSNSSPVHITFIAEACVHQACWACDLRQQLILALPSHLLTNWTYTGARNLSLSPGLP